jgi:septum formation protein
MTSSAANPQVVLASASPRREELLRLICPRFTVLRSDFDESTVVSWPPDTHVMDSAFGKASNVSEAIDDGVVIGADTIVVIDDSILGKPVGSEDARRMLRLLSGRVHQVYTGLCVILRSDGCTDLTLRDHVCTEVSFGTLSEEMIDFYVASGEPLDKAGAYGIQERGSLLVEGIVGDYFNVVGLPIYRLSRMLMEAGIPLFA